MNLDEEFPVSYLTAKEVDGWGKPQVLVIAGVDCVTVGRGPTASKKAMVRFHGLASSLLLNVTVMGKLKRAFGPESDNWVGRAVVVGCVDDQYMGRPVRAVRARAATDAESRLAGAVIGSRNMPVRPASEAEVAGVTAVGSAPNGPLPRVPVMTQEEVARRDEVPF